MHWIIFALLYAVVGAIVGHAYALLTGAVGPTFGHVVALVAVFGPTLLMVLAGFREVGLKRDFPLARAVYHTAISAFVMPMVLFGVALIAKLLGQSLVARMAMGIGYWSIPLIFVTAASYGFWRATKQFDRAKNATGGPGSTPPSGDGGTRPSTAKHAGGDRALPPGALRRLATAPAR